LLPIILVKRKNDSHQINQISALFGVAGGDVPGSLEMGKGIVREDFLGRKVEGVRPLRFV
jgi:hypothetical protein